jgi:hypothetical protein
MSSDTIARSRRLSGTKDLEIEIVGDKVRLTLGYETTYEAVIAYDEARMR